MTTYALCKRVIENRSLKTQEWVDAMQFKLDVFFAGERLTSEEYTELSGLLAT